MACPVVERPEHSELAAPKIGPCGRLAVAATPAAADQSFSRLDESMNKHSP
jgi:hypothetical protein